MTVKGLRRSDLRSDASMSRRGVLRGLGAGALASTAVAAGAAEVTAAAGLRLSTDRLEVVPGGRAAGWVVDVLGADDLPAAGALVEFVVRGGAAALLDASGAAVSSVMVRASAAGLVRAPAVVVPGVGSAVVDVRVPGVEGVEAAQVTVVATAPSGSWLEWGAGAGSTPRLAGASVPRPRSAVEDTITGSVRSVGLGRQRFTLDSNGLVWVSGAGGSPRLLSWSALHGARSLVAGLSSAYVVTGDGEVWGWGDDSRCQLGGQARRVTADEPVRIDGLPAAGVIELAAGACTAYALLSDGSVWSWGAGERGASGTGRLAPATACRLELPPVVGLAAGGRTAFAVGADAVLWGWGRNDLGQLGDGSTTDRHVPTAVHGAGAVRSVVTDGRTTRARV